MPQHVWVIEDDDSIAEVMALVLEQEGFVVHICTNYALEKHLFTTWPQPHIILLDVLMSGTDGRDVARDLRELPNAKETPIFFVSADIALEQRANEAHIQGFLRKPFNIDDLIALVRDNALPAQSN